MAERQRRATAFLRLRGRSSSHASLPGQLDDPLPAVLGFCHAAARWILGQGVGSFLGLGVRPLTQAWAGVAEKQASKQARQHRQHERKHEHKHQPPRHAQKVTDTPRYRHKQTSKQASKQTSKQANRQTRKHANTQTNTDKQENTPTHKHQRTNNQANASEQQSATNCITQAQCTKHKQVTQSPTKANSSTHRSKDTVNYK